VINLRRLYIFLREQLAQPDDPWVAETLLWWNKFRLDPSYSPPTYSRPSRKVFGDSPGTNGNRRPEVRDRQRPSMRERMENERRERVRAATPAPEE